MKEGPSRHLFFSSFSFFEIFFFFSFFKLLFLIVLRVSYCHPYVVYRCLRVSSSECRLFLNRKKTEQHKTTEALPFLNVHGYPLPNNPKKPKQNNSFSWFCFLYSFILKQKKLILRDSCKILARLFLFVISCKINSVLKDFARLFSFARFCKIQWNERLSSKNI